MVVLSLPILGMSQEHQSESVEHIVVTGTRTAKLLSNSPVLVEVVDGEDIAKISYGTVAQALNFIPGVVVKRSVKDGYNIQMQGFDGDHVLVLIDGQPIVSPTGSSADLDQIPASNIAQIEVIRGAASVMYGSSAMGGVINIITTKSDESLLKLDYDISQYHPDTIDSGDFNHAIKLNGAGEVTDWRVKLHALVIDDQGFDYDNETISQDAASVDKNFVTLGAGKNFSRINVDLKYQWLDEKKLRNSSQIPGRADVIYYQTDVSQQQFEFGVKSQIPATTPWQLNARYITHKEKSGQSNSLRDTEIELVEVNGQKVFQFNNIELVTGAVLHADKLDQYKPNDSVVEIDNESRESFEAFAQANWITKDYQLLAGIRGQHDSDFGWHNAVRLSAMKTITLGSGNAQLRAGFGQSYRVPNLKERFYVFDHSALGYMVLGNKDLSPETANSINASFTYNTSIANNAVDLSTDINVHYAKTEDLIDSIIDPVQSELTGLSIYQYQNINQAKTHGFDISADLSFNQWQMQVNYSYLSSEDDNDQRLFSRPRHQVKFNLNYDISAYDIELIAFAVYQADEAVPDSYQAVENNEFTTFNFVFDQMLSEQLSWRIRVENIFDEHKSSSANRQNLFDARPVSSRTLSAGISYQF